MTTQVTKRRAPEGDDDEDFNRGVKRLDVDIASANEDSVARPFLEEVAGIKASFEIALRNLKRKVEKQVMGRTYLRRNLAAPVRRFVVSQLRQTQIKIEEEYQKIKDACDHIYRCVKLARASQRAIVEAEWQSAVSDVTTQSVISEATGQSEIPDAAMSRATVQREMSEATADFILEKIHDFNSTTGMNIEQTLRNIEQQRPPRGINIRG